MRHRGIWGRMLVVMIVVFALSMVVAVAVNPAVAIAADAAVTAPAAAPAAASDLLNSVMALVAVVVSGMAAWALKLLAAKLKISISADQAASLQAMAKNGIYFAEEWAAKKFNLNNVAVSGSDKLSQATAFVLSKLPGVDTKEAQDAIHAVLGSLQGLGASATVGETNAT